jgi:hypothetical protein
MGTELTVSGFPHIGQDTDVTVCAHAACWSCFRYFSERYPTYREIYPYQITQLTTDLSGGRLLPSKGLFMEQVVEIFSRFGFYPRIYFRPDWETPDRRFERLLYYYLESGLPLVLGIKPAEPADAPSAAPDSDHCESEDAVGHAITAIGHTADLDMDTPHGRIFSDFYATGLVINDDNCMPYQVLPKDDHDHVFVDPMHVSDYRTSSIDSFVVPLYEKVYLAAEDVEGAALTLLQDAGVGLAANSSLGFEDLVVRIFLTTSRAYKAHRRSNPLPYDLARIYTRLPMPKFVWISELSTKAAYRRGEILGEIIWDATASDEDFFSWLVIHYPERLFVNDRSSDISGVQERHFPSPVPYSLFRHNLHEIG